ncbi:hypothetical protein B0T22DRAFT_61466 [Podospora appendiculata]|uniref:Uncharacterized protein n=1 Tax=Podospora appendiculata TaxID=314037 RepID=A0AAE0XII2_9PEZI|nr:hypothetical protein B0T22DRAFT_61466 [Podospora appendiculata]
MVFLLSFSPSLSGQVPVGCATNSLDSGLNTGADGSSTSREGSGQRAAGSGQWVVGREWPAFVSRLFCWSSLPPGQLHLDSLQMVVPRYEPGWRAECKLQGFILTPLCQWPEFIGEASGRGDDARFAPHCMSQQTVARPGPSLGMLCGKESVDRKSRHYHQLIYQGDPSSRSAFWTGRLGARKGWRWRRRRRRRRGMENAIAPYFCKRGSACRSRSIPDFAWGRPSNDAECCSWMVSGGLCRVGGPRARKTDDF